MNKNVKSIYQVIEEIKTKITDNQYKIVMDNLMVLNNNKEKPEEKQERDALLEQICFLYLYVPSIENENMRKLFFNRLELLCSNMVKHFR